MRRAATGCLRDSDGFCCLARAACRPAGRTWGSQVAFALSALILLHVGPTIAWAQREAPPRRQPAAQPAIPPNIRLQVQQMQQGGMLIPRQGRVVNGEEELAEDLIFPSDRDTLQQLERAKKAIEEEHFDDAVRLVGEILQGPEDYFFQPDRQQPLHRSLKAEAERIVGNLPPAGRQSYELQFGAEARRLLESARGADGISALADVARRFFHTEAGYEATWLLADHHLDHGRPLSAALCLKRLAASPAAPRWQTALDVKLAVCWARAGLTDQATATLTHAIEQGGKLRIENKPAQLPAATEDYAAWLARLSGQPPTTALTQDARWLLFRGDPSRAGVATGSSPMLNARWRMPTFEDPLAERIISQLRQMYLDQNLSAMVNLHPLVVDDVVLMRTTNRLLAVDLTTGKRLWWATSVDGPDALLDDESATDAGIQPQLATSLDQRVWEDATFGTLASNGTLVFSIEDLPLGSGLFSPRFTVGRGGRRHLVESGTFNRLAARNIRSGKLAWEIGGQTGDDALEQAGAFFLGPPLPLGDWLYCLAEVNSEIRLLAVAADTGKLEWSQQLALLERNIAQDVNRRMAGLSPSYADGVLVCPTGAGAVVAVDLTSRSLLWGYRYPSSLPQSMNTRLMIAQQRQGMQGQVPLNAAAWNDSSITIAAGKCYLTPTESQELHCLDLLEGTLAWKTAREDGLYVAGVHNGSLIVVGGTQVRGYHLADGQSTWPAGALAYGENIAPSGRGFLAGERYFLPLSSAEVATIDLAVGQIVAHSKARDGRVPGNLVAYRGVVLASGPEGIDCFYQLDELQRQVNERLAAKPNDAEALAQRGEILWHSGQLDEAIAALRQAHEAAPDNTQATGLLVDALLEGLRSDFRKYQLSGGELETLLGDTPRRGEYLHYLAAGLLANGQTREAFDACLKLVDASAAKPELDTIDSYLAVRRDRWVQTQFAAIWAEADEPLRAAIEQTLAERFTQAQAAGRVSDLRQFVAYFGSLPGAEEARIALADLLVDEGEPLERELLVRSLVDSRDRALAARACRLMAELTLAGPQPEQAALYLRRLQTELADVVCAGDQTGKTWVVARAGDAATQRALAADGAWPVGRVVVDRTTKQGQYAKFPTFDLRGRQEPFFQDAGIEFDLHRRSLVGRNGLGNEVWRVALNSDQDNNLQFNQQANPAMATGHLLMIAVGGELFAIDTLGKAANATDGGSGFGRVLWRQSLNDSLPGASNLFMPPRQMQFNLGWRRMQGGDMVMQGLGMLGSLGETQAYYIANRTLVAADLLTGEMLWSRRNFALGATVWGDRDVVAVVPPDGVEATVLRAADGALLGTCVVPSIEQRLGYVGRRLLTWSNENAHSVLELRDVWPDTPLWRHNFAIDAKAVMLGDDEVAVVEPQGRFVILGLPEGRILTEQLLEPEENLADIAVLRSRDHYTLVVNRTWQRSGQNIFVQPIPLMNPSPLNPLVNGRVYGFDRKTRARLWMRELESQGLNMLQPAETPVLVFAAHVASARNGPNSPPTMESLVVCLDKRTGKTLHEERFAQQVLYDLMADQPGRTVTLVLQQPNQRTHLTLKFTDEPEPPAAAAPVTEQPPADEQPDPPAPEGSQ